MHNDGNPPRINLNDISADTRPINLAPITFHPIAFDYNTAIFKLLSEDMERQNYGPNAIIRRFGLFVDHEAEQRLYRDLHNRHHYARPPTPANSAPENNFEEMLANFRRQLNSNRITDGSERYAVDEDTPDRFICLLTLEIMRDPVFVVADNRYYEREALQAWHDSFNAPSEYGRREPCCPISRGIALSNPQELPTDIALKAEIDEYRAPRQEAQRQTPGC